MTGTKRRPRPPREFLEEARAIARGLPALVEGAHEAGWRAGARDGAPEGGDGGLTLLADTCVRRLSAAEWGSAVLLASERREELSAIAARSGGDVISAAQVGGAADVLSEVLAWALEHRSMGGVR